MEYYLRIFTGFGVHETYELRINDEVLQVQIEAGDIRVQQGKALKADLQEYAGRKYRMQEYFKAIHRRQQGICLADTFGPSSGCSSR